MDALDLFELISLTYSKLETGNVIYIISGPVIFTKITRFVLSIYIYFVRDNIRSIWL